MKTLAQRVALIFGVVFILVAVLGFLTDGGTSMTSDMATAPRLLGLFHVNLLHNVVHLLFGIWGVLAARTWPAARTYCRVGGIIYLVLMVLGFIAPDGFGIVPLGGNDIWLHAVLGLVLAGVGFTDRGPAGNS
ncbi:MAG: DUF4383 domain-containing protein [Longimicrobiaceae bacterium]